MPEECVLPCLLKKACPRKRRVADPNGFCRYQVGKFLDIIDENKQTEVKP